MSISSLTEECINKFKLAFSKYDKDGDGALDIVGDGVQGSGLTNSASQPVKEIWWKNVSGKFIYTVKNL